MYVDDYLQLRVQHSDDDTSAKISSVALGSDHVRLFGRRKVGVTPIPAPQTNTDWDTTIDALSFTINSHTTRVSVPRKNIEGIKSLLFEQWPQSRREATARGVLSMTAKLLNFTYVVRAGK